MTEENVELVRRWWVEAAEWLNDSGRDPEQLAEMARYVSDEITYEEDPVWPDSAIYRGPDAIAARFVEYTEALGMRGTELEAVIDAGDLVFVEMRIHFGGGSDSGESLTFLWGYTVKVEDGRIAHIRAWFDPAEGRRAAGLEPASDG